MKHTSTEPKGNVVRSALLRLIDANKAQLASLEALAEAVNALGSERSERSERSVVGPISELDAMRELGLTRGWLREHGGPFTRGPKQRRYYDKARILAALMVSPDTPTEAPIVANENADPLDTLLASGRLRRAGR